jgi:uncharacterized NAD-dependent epimerase/dehydratase family protein
MSKFDDGDDDNKPEATILARGYYDSSHAKTAHGLIRHGQKYAIREVIDETLVGKDAGEVIGMSKLGIPIVDDINYELDTLIIGVAPVGGKLPKPWRSDIKSAIQHGMDIVSGLHEFLSVDPEFQKLAERSGSKLIDVRKPPPTLEIAKGIKVDVPVVLVSGTDSSVGKRTAALELVRSAKSRGIDAGFVATGQTGIMIGCDAGVAVDAVQSDFVSGIVESMVVRVAQTGKKLIIVEGQGAISQYAYGAVALGILYGAQPDYVVLVHDPSLKMRSSFPNEPMPTVEHEIKLIEALLPHTEVIGLALNCKSVKDWQSVIASYEARTSLPTTDVLKVGGDKLIDCILNRIKATSD